MTFKRTRSSLHSLHRFFNTDIVVFCEGGDSLNYESAIGAAQNTPTLDTFFWESLIRTLGLNKRFHFKSVGAKSIATAIAQEVESLGVTTISVCMDRDYDGCLGRLAPYQRVCYSTGYSWENDALNNVVVKEILADFIGCGENERAKIEEYENKIYALGNELIEWTEIDISLKRLNKASVFNRSKPASSLDFNNIPKLRTMALRVRLSELGYRRRPNRVIKLKADQTVEICFGKLISQAVYHLVAEIMEFFHVKRLSYDQFMRLAITKTANHLNDPMLGRLSAVLRSQTASFL